MSKHKQVQRIQALEQWRKRESSDEPALRLVSGELLADGVIVTSDGERIVGARVVGVVRMDLQDL